jgi:hypothetical protein
MKYLIFLCSLCLLSCSMQKNVLQEYQSEGFTISSLKGSSILLHVNPDIDPGIFKQVFDAEYRTPQVFCTKLTDGLKEQLGSRAVVHMDASESLDSLFLNRSQSKENIEKATMMFDKTGEKYIVGIKRVMIAQKIDQNEQLSQSTTAMSVSRGGRSSGSSSSTNSGIKTSDCTIVVTVEVWSVAEKKKVSQFSSIGESKIFLAMYGRAFNEALDNAISNMVDYIHE